MSAGNYSVRRTYNDGDILGASDYVADHQQHITFQNPVSTAGYSDDPSQMRLSTDPGDINSESLSTSLAGELERLRFTLREIKSKLNASSVLQWYAKTWSVTVSDGTITNAKLAAGATFVQYLRAVSTNVALPDTSTADVTLISQAITLSRGKVRIRASINASVIQSAGGAGQEVTLSIKRGASTVATRNLHTGTDRGAGTLSTWLGSIEFLDQPGPGAVTYNFTLKMLVGGLYSMSGNENEMTLEEIA